MKMLQAILEIDSDLGPKTYSLNPDRANSFEELYVDFQLISEGGGNRYTLFLHPKQDLVVKRLEIQFEVVAQPDTRFFANGYQSWSESRLLPVDAGIPSLRTFAKPFLGHYGDGYIPGISRKSGSLHSWTYTYLTGNGGEVRFWGSVNENTGFTLFIYNSRDAALTVRKDMENLTLTHSFPALDFWTGQGEEASMFDAWASVVGRTVSSPESRRTNSSPYNWTSWHRYSNQITEDIILKNLESVAGSGLPFHYFLIDDGWQTAAGDWRSTKPEFPGGMRQIAQKIREKGLEPGLWLAPFVASAQSQLAKRNPEWLLKTPNGKPLRVGWNAHWGGWFYALDFYHPAVQDYLSGVFHIVLDQWGYGLVKLDFLFAACLLPPKGKTRGQMMHDVMAFLRQQVGERKMLASGVPLAAASDLADFCRISGDIHLSWEHKLQAFLGHRERVSTLASLRSTLSRWQLNGRCFLNEPDVFMLRREKQHLTPDQQNTLLTVNALLGGVLFTSDDVGAYTPEQRAELEDALTWRGSRIGKVKEAGEDIYQIDFEQHSQQYSAFCNLTGRQVALPVLQNGNLELLPFETIILKR